MADTKKIVNKSLQNTLYIGVFTILPFLLGLLINALYSKDVIFYEKGEFFIYGVSLLSSSILSYQNLDKIKDLTKGWINIISILLTVLFASAYAMTTSITAPPNVTLFKWLSVCILLISLIIFYISQHMFNKAILLKKEEYANSDVRNKRNNEQEEIENKLN